MEEPKRIWWSGKGAVYTVPVNKPEYIRADLVREVVEAAEEAKRQIEYLHGKFQETGTGNAVIARLESALKAMEG